MNIFPTYFATTLGRGYALVGLALVALFSIFTLVSEADFVGNGTYTLSDALLVVAVSSPALFVDIAPFIAMLGTLWGLSILVQNSEIVAIRAAGVSSYGIVRICALAILGLCIVLTSIEILARPAHKWASLYRTYETATDGNTLPDSGFWISQGQFHVNIGTMVKETGPADIQIFTFNDDLTLREFTQGVRATVLGPNDWRLTEVITKRYTPSHIENSSSQSKRWTPVWDPGALLVELPVESFNLYELRRQIANLVAQGRDATAVRFEFWKRCLTPLSAIGFALFSAAFVLSLNPRRGHGARVTLGAFAAILVYLAQQIGTNVALILGATPSLAAALPAIAVTALGLTLARRLEFK